MTDYYTNPFSVTSQFYFCGLPLRLDTYRGCAFQCGFCFARFRGGNTPGKAIVPANPKSIERIITRAHRCEHEEEAGIVGQFLKKRVPVHLGGMSDPFQPAETRFRVTQTTLRVLSRFEYPT